MDNAVRLLQMSGESETILEARIVATTRGRPLKWPLRALVVGAADQPEFVPLVAQLKEHTNARFVDGLATTRESLASGDLEPPDLIVLMAARAGEFSAVDVEVLRRFAPLARVVVVVGSCCEGETRSGKPLDGTTRVYAHASYAFFARELRMLAAGACGTLSLPVTVAEEERFLHATTIGGHVPCEPQGTIGVYSHTRPAAEMLVDACRALGFDAVDLLRSEAPSVAPLAACLWDDPMTEAADFEALRAEYGAGLAPWIALLNFPRVEEQQQALTGGACAVLSKPLAIDDLREALQRAIGDRP